MWCVISFTLLLVIKTISTSDLTYKAAVIEYHPHQHHDSITYLQLCEENVQTYIDLLKKSPHQLDIAVFPEDTITTLRAFNHRKDLIEIGVQLDTSHKLNPCLNGDFPDYIKNISCAAKELKTYIVINTVEKIQCQNDDEREKDCTEEWNLYNTNIVFDREGTILVKYRKFNLFNEAQNCRPKKPEHVIFRTDFGVDFGMFTCFDILFEEPGIEVVRLGVKHFVYPTMWFAEAPFLTALQVQNMWSAGNDVTLLAANANDPQVGSGGSGIYQGLKGPRELTIVANGTKLIIADVYKSKSFSKTPKEKQDENEIDKKGAERDGFRVLAENLKSYTSYKIDESFEKTLCHGNFCCNFSIEIDSNPTDEDHYKYRVFVFSGVRSFHGATNGGLEICAVVFCKGDTQESCGQRILPYSKIVWPKKFKKIQISGSFDTNHKVHFPNTMLSSLEPIPEGDYEWTRTETKDGIDLKLSLINEQNRLFTFGIYGRNFARDHEQPDKLEKTEL